MTTATRPIDTDDVLSGAIAAACDRIAPTWPLDQFAAVNPYWGWKSSPATSAAAHLGVLAGTTLTMPRSWYRDEWLAGRLDREQISVAASALGYEDVVDVAIAVLDASDECVQPLVAMMALATDVRDLDRAPSPGQRWRDVVTHQISQYCGAHFDCWQGTWHPDQDLDVFSGWRRQLSLSRGTTWRLGRAWGVRQLGLLPDAPIPAIAAMLADLQIPAAGHESYLSALLLDVNGWAAWCAYRRWQARLTGGDDDEIVGVLAIRLAWEWLLRHDADSSEPDRWQEWAKSWDDVDARVSAAAAGRRVDWVLQAALERTYQAGVIDGVSEVASRPTGPPVVQAAFCIDVRSEILRRAVESVNPEILTKGFAGFFGLPISYTPVGTALTRPQLPVLLSPSLHVTEVATNDLDVAEVTEDRSRTLAAHQRWDAFHSVPSSVFTFVESFGLLAGPKLVANSRATSSVSAPWEQDGLRPEVSASVRPRLSVVDDDPAAAAQIGANVLRAMSLRDGFAPLVLLCGHGSHTTNNPHASGLDCGACGGQAGDVNARVIADLLNSQAVREHLVAHGITVPSTTWFLPGLHNTTTDDVQLLDTDLVPPDMHSAVDRLRDWLAAAGELARAERSDALGLGDLAGQPQRLRQALQERCNDWSQVRPEWGLAGNAVFVVAPRSRTSHIDFAGRCFLHDYDSTVDSDNSVLTLIMTAPMVVTNWINMQYNASTVDNSRYGSGNKVLHNVVGGRIGVFEGNGGDLRIGLPMQSLHDGTTLRHRPLRLSVFIEAPRDRIDAVIAAHAVVSDLVVNGWIHLLRIESATGAVERRTSDGWVAA